MQASGYDIDIIVSGFPGKAVCHGGLGWSTIALLRGHGRVALVDAGSFGMRKLLLEGLARRGLAPADVTDLLLTHSHYDHSVNWTLFKHARIVIGATEMSWALEQPWGTSPVPELYVEKLDDWPTVVKIRDGEEAMPGIRCHLAPGISRMTDMTYDAAVSRASIEMIWRLWRRRSGSILVPGHDLPMTQSDGATTYLGTREAAITAWFGDDMEQTTLFQLAARQP
jgi:N-acyl homoserine lactone hydrolase